MSDDTGHGRNLDPDAERGLEAMRDYEIGIAKERAGFEQAKIGRDQAIGAAVRYGQALIDGRARRNLSNNDFGDWIHASRLDRTPPFDQRQERAAAQQIAEIALKHVASTVDGNSTGNPFDGCPHSRPTNIMRWWRGKQPKPAPEPRASAAETVRAAAPEKPEPSPTPTAPTPASAAPKAASVAPDRMTQRAADNAEIETLKKELAARTQELWDARDALDQLAIYLKEHPQPKAENRPVNHLRAWPLRFYSIRRPKGSYREIIDPQPNDPAFAIRKEEFEQWFVRRREALEHLYEAKDAERKKAFDAKVRERVEAQLEKEERQSQRLTDAQFMKIATCFHIDKRKHMTERDWDRTFAMFMNLRKLVVIKPKAKKPKGKASPGGSAPDPAPDSPPKDEPPAGALS